MHIDKIHDKELLNALIAVSNKINSMNDDKIIEHLKNVKLLQAMYADKKFYVQCYPTDIGAIRFPHSNMAVKEIELPNFELHEEKIDKLCELSMKQSERALNQRDDCLRRIEKLKEQLEFYFRNYYTNLLGNSAKTNQLWVDFKQTNGL